MKLVITGAKKQDNYKRYYQNNDHNKIILIIMADRNLKLYSHLLKF